MRNKTRFDPTKPDEHSPIKPDGTNSYRNESKKEGKWNENFER